ncbi:MAG: class I SAM-dependent methyltransferase [Bacteroidota bacterium]
MKKTDWDYYYSHPNKLASFTRKITSDKLIRLLKQFSPSNRFNITIAELGGANSCFYESINKAFSPYKYLIVDNNKEGLDKTIDIMKKSDNIELKYENVLNSTEGTEEFDIVFSVGLIEHFPPEGTSKCISAHFNYLKDRGICIVTFPTPTWLYKLVRKCSELLGLWIFHDERPLKINEVLNEIKKYATIKHCSITWTIILTQGVIVAEKN